MPQAAEDLPAILAVDDCPEILAIVGVMLRQLGFAFLLAAGGWEAIDLYRQHRDRIVLVLLDVTMPGMDGPATLDALRAIDPAVRCYFMSGGFSGYTGEDLVARGAAGLLDKPFSITHLAGALAQ
jgi:CheY-like chemotaxis protein